MSCARKLINNVLVVILFLPALLAAHETSAEELGALVSHRLGYMKAVAAYKWLNQLPIENQAREQLVLSSAVRQGLRHKLTRSSSEHFFKLQIEAAKEVQSHWFKKWQHDPASVPATVADLDGEIRPALLRLGEDITAGLATLPTKLDIDPVEGLSQNTRTRLSLAAKAVEVYPNQLVQVLDSGVLRVGTTGDYAPFSLQADPPDRHETHSGIDIDLAKNLANTLGVEIEWVQTSWPNLMADLHRGRYDIGMSGISIDARRQQTAFFSRAYHRGGKSAIFHCSDKNSFTSLKSIDKPSTRLIVNPGGTNQAFVNANIRQAMITVHDDNRTIFEEIIQRKADVMITDQIEVRLQISRHPQLCAAFGNETLTTLEKAFLMPQDIVWKTYVDTWLGQRLDDGLVGAVFDKHTRN